MTDEQKQSQQETAEAVAKQGGEQVPEGRSERQVEAAAGGEPPAFVLDLHLRLEGRFGPQGQVQVTHRAVESGGSSGKEIGRTDTYTSSGTA